ncbi:MAG: potassium transporter TrkG [Nautiliaceae bacterium]
MSWFDEINHAFATISTSGFSTKNKSLGFWINNYWILWTTTTFMFISAINFIAHIKAFKRNFSGYKSEEVKWFTFVSLIHYFSSNDFLWFALTNRFKFYYNNNRLCNS